MHPPAPAPTPARRRTALAVGAILVLGGLALAAYGLTTRRDRIDTLDGRYGPLAFDNTAETKLTAPESGPLPPFFPNTLTIRDLAPDMEIQIERPVTTGAGLPRDKLGRTIDPNPGPVIRAAATDTVTLWPGHTLRILAFVVRDRSINAAAQDRAFSPSGAPMSAAAFARITDVDPFADLGDQSTYRIVVVASASHPLSVNNAMLFPLGHPEAARPLKGVNVGYETSGGPVFMIYPEPIVTTDGKLELAMNLYGGPTFEVPIPEKDGQRLETPYGTVLRLGTTGRNLGNATAYTSSDIRFETEKSGQTVFLQASETMMAREAPWCTDDKLPWQYDNTWIIRSGPDGAPASRPRIFTRSARLRMTLPENLPHPDFAAWDPLDSPLPAGSGNASVYSMLPIWICAPYTAEWYTLNQTLKCGDVPNAKTYRDLLRYMSRHPTLRDLDMAWYPISRVLTFANPPTLKDRFYAFTENHLPWLHDLLP